LLLIDSVFSLDKKTAVQINCNGRFLLRLSYFV